MMGGGSGDVVAKVEDSVEETDMLNRSKKKVRKDGSGYFGEASGVAREED